MDKGMVIMIAVAAVSVVSTAGYYVLKVAPQKSENTIRKVREWLLYAVTVAEQELGSGTGKLKLRYVYDWFLKTFPKVAGVISFETFSALVDDALVEMKNLIETNEKVAGLVSQQEGE